MYFPRRVRTSRDAIVRWSNGHAADTKERKISVSCSFYLSFSTLPSFFLLSILAVKEELNLSGGMITSYAPATIIFREVSHRVHSRLGGWSKEDIIEPSGYFPSDRNRRQSRERKRLSDSRFIK